MKYILSESQNLEFLKKIIFNYWDKNGINLNTHFYNFFSLNRVKHDKIISDYIIEYLGGIPKIKKDLKKLEDKILNGLAGTYDFKFYVRNIHLKNFDIIMDAVLDKNGTCNVDCEKIHTNIYDASYDDECGWEVRDELRETCKESEEFSIWEKRGFMITIEELDFINFDELT